MTPTSGGLITGTNSISVMIDSSFNLGFIKVHGVNSCGDGGDSPLFYASTSAFTHIPSTPAPINWLKGTVYGYCTGNTYVFSTSSNSNAECFQWSTTAGTIIDGQGTNTVTITINNPQTRCVLTVTASNCVGISGVRKLSISSVLPASTMNGAASVCKNINPLQMYSVASVGNPTSYNWSSTTPSIKFLDGGAPINPLNTIATSVSVDFSAVPIGKRNVRVTANNNCGRSAIRTKSVLVSNNCLSIGNEVSAEGKTDIIVFPNPVHDIITVYFDSAIEGNYKLRLTDITGRIDIAKKGLALEGSSENSFNLEAINPGICSLTLVQNNTIRQIRIIKE